MSPTDVPPAHATSHPARQLMHLPHTSLPSPLMVHLRLPRESAASNRSELTQNQPTLDASRTTTRSLRRRRDSSDDDTTEPRADGATSDSGSSVANSGDSTGRKKPRKPTYLLQKEEKETLLQELHLLEARAEMLRAQVGMPSLVVHQTTQQKRDENAEMERARRAQLLSLCSLQSVFSGFMREQFSGPLKVPVHLGRDMAQRRATLMALRREKLDLAYRFMEHRLQGVDQRLPLDDSVTWTSAEGDFCFSRTDISFFEGVQSVKQVFDALQFYVANMEITISEVLGQLTLREDIDCVDTRATNHRIISSTDHGIVVENNSVSFAEYYQRFSERSDEEFGLFTVDCVDEDELYPYRPLERVRKNLTAAITLSAYRKPVAESATAGGDSSGDLVVAMCRSAYLTLKRPQFHVSAVALEDLRGTVGAWGQVMNKTVREYVNAQTAQRRRS